AQPPVARIELELGEAETGIHPDPLAMPRLRGGQVRTSSPPFLATRAAAAGTLAPARNRDLDELRLGLRRAQQLRRVVARWQCGEGHAGGCERVGRDTVTGTQSTRAVTDQRGLELDREHGVLRARHGADGELALAEIEHQACADGHPEQALDRRACL